MRLLRRALWLRFHLWTLGFIALVTALNVSTQLRPYASTSLTAGTAPMSLAASSVSLGERSPASSNDPSTAASKAFGQTRALKLASLGCEPHLQLEVSNEVRQLRLKFDVCPTGLDAFDEIVQVSNATNGFQATVFSADASGGATASATGSNGDSHINAETEMPGVFMTPESKTGKSSKVAKEKAQSQARRPASDPVSTDYISLAEGANEIRIQRTDRIQSLQILRK